MNTTIALSKEVYNQLQAVKHKLEKKNHCDYSFGGTVQYLIEVEEEKDGRRTT